MLTVPDASLPGLCPSFVQLIEPVLAADTAVFSSNTRLESRLGSLRRCFENAISYILTARNTKALPFPNDVWLLVLEYLPLEDLISASRVCRTWRAAALSNSHLWTQLTLHVDDQRGPPGPPWYTSNIPVLADILPRSKEHFLDLEVRFSVTNPDAVGEYNDAVMDFFDLVSPRLANLHIVSGSSLLIGPILSDYGMDFPELRTLIVSPPPSGCSGREPQYLVVFSGMRMPKLVSLCVHADIRMFFRDRWPMLQILNCTSEGLDGIEPLVRSARGLRRFTFNWTYQWFQDIDFTPPDERLTAALGAILDVHITAELAPVFEYQIFCAFGSSTAQRLLLTFQKCEHYTGSFKPRACSRLSSATRLSIVSRGDPDCTEIVLEEDDAARTTRITMQDIPRSSQHAAVDWALVPSLDSLTVLRVDASIWSDVMCNFPRAPRLAELVLDIHGAGEIETIMADARRVPLPRAELLTVVTETDVIGLNQDQVQKLKAAVGASSLTLSGIPAPSDTVSDPGYTME